MSDFRYLPIASWGTDRVLVSGTAFVNLNDQAADEVVLVNSADGAALDMRQAQRDDTQYVELDAPSGLTVGVTNNANEIMVRRHDQGATQVAVRYIWRKYRR